jgi:hypothetical protein
MRLLRRALLAMTKTAFLTYGIWGSPTKKAALQQPFIINN